MGNIPCSAPYFTRKPTPKSKMMTPTRTTVLPPKSSARKRSNGSGPIGAGVNSGFGWSVVGPSLAAAGVRSSAIGARPSTLGNPPSLLACAPTGIGPVARDPPLASAGSSTVLRSETGRSSSLGARNAPATTGAGVTTGAAATGVTRGCPSWSSSALSRSSSCLRLWPSTIFRATR